MDILNYKMPGHILMCEQICHSIKYVTNTQITKLAV